MFRLIPNSYILLQSSSTYPRNILHENRKEIQGLRVLVHILSTIYHLRGLDASLHNLSFAIEPRVQFLSGRQTSSSHLIPELSAIRCVEFILFSVEGQYILYVS